MEEMQTSSENMKLFYLSCSKWQYNVQIVRYMTYLESVNSDYIVILLCRSSDVKIVICKTKTKNKDTLSAVI